MTYRVLLTDNDLGDPAMERDLLSSRLDADLIVRQCRTEVDVLNAVTEVDPDAIIVQWAPITAAALEAAPNLRVVSRIGIGVDMIDLVAARQRGIPVRNVPHYCTEEVATHAVAMALALWRRLPQFDAEVRAGIWNAAAASSSIKRLSRSTIGLIGMGRIGRLVADAFAVWGGRVIVSDPIRGDDRYERVDVATIAAESDLITLHAPLLPETRHVVGAAFVSATRRNPILVNVSRGPLVETDAVVAALADGTLAGAGLDVFESEPLPADHPIRTAPNTLLAPHAAWCSADAMPELRATAVLNVVEELGV